MIRSLFLNTGSNVLVLVVKLAITFIMTPIFVHNLGNYDYGLWEMLGAVIGYMGLLDLGIKPAISRFAAKYHAEKDQDSLLIIYMSTMFFMALVGALLCAFFVCWGLFFPEIIAQDSTDVERYTLLLLIIGAQLAIVFPGYVAESYLEGFQKYYLKNNVTIFNSILGSFLVYLYITPENGLILLALVNAIGMASKYLFLMFLLSRPAYGAIKLKKGNFSWVRLKEIIVFGFKSFIQGISTRLENATDSLVIGYFLSPAMVPFYSIPANLVNYIRTLGWTLTHAFMPLFSQLNALNENDKIRSVYFNASRYVIAFILPLSAGVCMVGGPFIGVWIGPQYRENADIIIVLLVLFTSFPFINPFSNRLLTAVGKHGIFAKLTPISALINILVSVALVQEYGIIGAAIGSVVPVFIFIPIYLVYSCRHLQVSVWDYLRSSVMPCLLPTGVMILVLLGIRLEWQIDNYTEILASAAVGMLAYLPLFILFTLKKEERAFILSKFKKPS